MKTLDTPSVKVLLTNIYSINSNVAYCAKNTVWFHFTVTVMRLVRNELIFPKARFNLCRFFCALGKICKYSGK